MYHVMCLLLTHPFMLKVFEGGFILILRFNENVFFSLTSLVEAYSQSVLEFHYL